MRTRHCSGTPRATSPSLTDTSGDTTYTYDVDGSLLLKENDKQKVLYAGDTEVTYDKAASATSAKRNYDTGLGILAVRHGDDPADITFQVADGQGTAQIALDATTLAPVYRRQMPYGEDRGLAPAAWPNERGFLGKPADKDTGLTGIGARDYDPLIGRFISVDPLLMTDFPAQMLGYSYGNNNPTTYSDPSGAGPICGGEPCIGHYDVHGIYQHDGKQPQYPDVPPDMDTSSRGSSKSKGGDNPVINGLKAVGSGLKNFGVGALHGTVDTGSDIMEAVHKPSLLCLRGPTRSHAGMFGSARR
ncbi:RHS repeat-associated core domain-containing protein [Nocardioides sp. W3-2-3]|uniref:RHS repeat-associated core domain-containing protein n=1 Tax=Nocardioides convexus TaxID=2712224 RepID=UPI002418B71D|nr:RHS repeat-associated core domain-containing protein [Nocardioides convexus]NHA01777.1 RHS repeat-associated core domain-containing protein [Nocardioides convexus]